MVDALEKVVYGVKNLFIPFILIILVLAIIFSQKFRVFAIVGVVLFGLFLIIKNIDDKKTKLILTILGIIALVVFIIFSNVSQSITYGSTIMSISTAQIIDQGERIVITGTVNGADNLLIDFNKDQINSLIDGYEVTDISTMRISMTDPSREFTTSSSNVGVVYKTSSFNIGVLKSCKNNLPSSDSIFLYNKDQFLTQTCYYAYPSGEIREFTGREIDNSAVTFTIDKDLIGTINPSSGSNVVRSSDGKTVVEWTGNLANFEQLSTPYQYKLLFGQSKYEKLVSSSAKSNMESAYKSLLVCSTISPLLGPCIDNYNTAYNIHLSDKSNEYKSSVNAENIELTSSGLKVYPSTATVFPTFRITLDAEYVAIKKLSGIPKITSCPQDYQIKSGEYYNAQIGVKNVGSDTGSFYGSIVCSGDSNIPTFPIAEKSVGEGSTSTFTSQISGINDLSGIQTNNCKVQVYDRVSGLSDSCSFNLKVEYVDTYVPPVIVPDKDCSQNSDCDEGYICSDSVCVRELVCDKWWQEEGIKTSYKFNVLGIIKFGKVDEPVCKTADWLYYSIGGLVIIALGSLAIVLYFKKGK